MTRFNSLEDLASTTVANELMDIVTSMKEGTQSTRKAGRLTLVTRKGYAEIRDSGPRGQYSKVVIEDGAIISLPSPYQAHILLAHICKS